MFDDFGVEIKIYNILQALLSFDIEIEACDISQALLSFDAEPKVRDICASNICCFMIVSNTR